MPLKSRGSVSARLSVWFSRSSRSRNASMPDGEHFEAAHVELGERSFAPHEMQRGAPLGARLGECERTGREVEQRQA